MNCHLFEIRSSAVELLDTWTKSSDLPSSLKWWSVTTSSDGQYKTAGSLAVPSASVPGYFFRSNDSGQSWTEADDNWSFYAAVSDFTGQYILAAEYPDGIFFSSDYGQTFAKTSAPASQWYNLATDINGTIFYGASLNDTIYRSLDGGSAWEALNVTGNAAANTAGFYSVSCDGTGQYVYATTFYNANYYGGKGKIYFSNDYGVTWNQSTTVNAGYISIASSFTGQYVYAAANVKGIYRSSDYGQTFTKVNTMSSSLNYFWVATDLSGANVITIISNGPLYYSNNYGTSWTKSNDATTSGNRDWKRVAFNGNGTSIIASIGVGTSTSPSVAGIVIGDIVTVYPSPTPTYYPTYILTETPTMEPTYNVTYIYLGRTQDTSTAPIFSFIIMILIICCCSMSVALYRVRYLCVYYWYRCTGRVPPAYYSDTIPRDDQDLGYAAAATPSHPQAEAEIVNSSTATTAASGRHGPSSVVTVDAVVIEEGIGVQLSNVPVARGATEIPCAFPEPVPVVTTGYAEVVESYAGSTSAPRANRRTIGTSGNRPTPTPVHSITGSQGHHRSRQQSHESSRDQERGQRRTRGGQSNAVARTDNNRTYEV
jgi:photosystem II stability/assembly factor-like uncharacterized protein